MDLEVLGCHLFHVSIDLEHLHSSNNARSTQMEVLNSRWRYWIPPFGRRQHAFVQIVLLFRGANGFGSSGLSFASYFDQYWAFIRDLLWYIITIYYILVVLVKIKILRFC
jgi:hypothetical protein